ncbi:MAG: PD-(D/E)XK nuclease family protein [Gammaproteobacteria bacterium]
MNQFGDLLFSLDSQATVLTGSRRLAHHLRTHYDEYQFQQGKIIWETIDILPWETWIERCWQEWGVDSRIILNDFQEQLAWEQVICEISNEPLLQISDIAKNAKEAWKLLQKWNLTLDDLTHFADENILIFIVWAKAFLQLCCQEHWLDHATLTTKLTQSLTQQSFRLSKKRILLAGFDLFTPQQQRLLDIIQQYVQVEQLLTQTQPRVRLFHENAKKEPIRELEQKSGMLQSVANVSRIGLLDTEQEIYHMAAWAKQLWQANPQQRIACIVPELSNLRDAVNRIFSEVFVPSVLLPGNDKTNLPFNISVGKWLANYPMVHDALQTLTLNFYETDITTLSELLRSPFLGGGLQEAEARAALDLELRRNTIKLRLTVRDTFALAQQTTTAHHCPRWITQVRAFLQTNSQTQKTQLPSQWSEIFQNQLNCLGWPGDRTLDSAEYQIEQRWQGLLDEFSGLDSILRHINLQSALHHLNHLAGSVLFQPETPETPVQILGQFEASGLTFDALWVMGLSDRSWPLPLTPNPLLPMALQQRLAMPKANGEHELRFYQHLTQQLANSAPQVIFSYPQKTDDYTLQASPLIINYDITTPARLNLQIHFLAETIFAQRALETWKNDTAPLVTPFEKIKGGAEILKHQAACPMRAFAICRLHAHAIPTPQFGLDNRQRGTLVHATLMNVWQNIQDHAQLQQLSSFELNEVVANAVTAALQQFMKKHPFGLAAHYLKLEAHRLQQLVQEWLTLEKQREPFKVLAHEQTQAIVFSGLALSLRLDRIDELPDGSQIIIDYKTGQNVSVSDWFDDRPEEPQLPLYAVINSDKIKGLLFAQVRAGKLQFKGITEHDQGIANKNVEIRADWPLLVEDWRNKLQQLAQDFSEGKALVDPREQPKTCQQCDLQTFCRVRQM